MLINKNYDNNFLIKKPNKFLPFLINNMDYYTNIGCARS